MIINGIGVDIVEIKRFLPFKKNKENRFLINNFGKKELEHCFAFRDPAPHLAGTFAAKEAVYKALGRTDILQSVIEVRRGSTGEPVVWIKNRRENSILVSISHTTKTAVAVAIKQ